MLTLMRMISLEEVIQIIYCRKPIGEVVLFSCKWLDYVINEGIKLHLVYWIVKVKYTKGYEKDDSFIFV